jgi:large subunit ribosomal protein L5
MADDSKKGGAKKGDGDQPQKPPKASKPGKGDKADKGGKKAKGGERASPSTSSVAPHQSTTDAIPPRLLDRYKSEIVPALTKQFNYKNMMQVPRLKKLVVNMGLGAAVANPKIIDAAVEELKAMCGQKPVVTRAKKAIANFKLRAGIPIGAMVTLRRARMWEFLDRLVMVALPRMRDFKGVSRKAFDGKGNYTLGLREQIIFPEINYDKIDAIKGLNISFVTTARTDEEGRALLQQLGMPFRAT